MTTAEYITNEIGRERLATLVRNGVVPMQIAMHLEIYEWHTTHGRNRERTAEHFRVSTSLVGYAVTKMKQPIINN